MTEWLVAPQLPTSEWLLLVEGPMLDCALEKVKDAYLVASCTLRPSSARVCVLNR